jgi:hypothetical protein
LYITHRSALRHDPTPSARPCYTPMQSHALRIQLRMMRASPPTKLCVKVPPMRLAASTCCRACIILSLPHLQPSTQLDTQHLQYLRLCILGSKRVCVQVAALEQPTPSQDTHIATSCNWLMGCCTPKRPAQHTRHNSLPHDDAGRWQVQQRAHKDGPTA